MNTKPNNVQSLVQRSIPTEDFSLAQHKILQAADSLRPAGTQHLGSVALHFYGETFGIEPSAQVIVQPASIKHLPEELVIHGLNALRDRLMELFGHTPPRKVKR